MSSITGGSGAKNFITDSGTAVAVASTINIEGAGGITTSASGNTVTIDGSGITGGIVTINGDSGSATGATVTFSTTELKNATPQFTASGSQVDFNFGDANDNLIISTTTGSTTLTTAGGNTGYGNDCFNSLTSGLNNVGLGVTSFLSLTSGSSNCAFGRQPALFLTEGNFNLIMGAFQAGVSYTGAESSNILIEHAGVLGENNTMRIGTTGSGDHQVNRTFIAGVDGTNVGSVAKVVTMNSEQMGTATITAGSGISVTPGANTITISASATAFSWSVITADQSAVAGNGYFTNKAGTVCAVALPATSSVGDTISIVNINAQGWQITQGAGQQIFFGVGSSTLGATGTLSSAAVGDSATLVCRTANTEWQVINYVGSIVLA